jgi:hypothetical protein
MNAPNTRVDTHALKALVADLERHLDELEARAGTLLVALTADERKAMPRVREGFAPAARTLSNVLRSRPEIAALTEYDAASVVEDLDNAELLAPLMPRLELLAQRVADSHLQWMAEAQEPTLAAYSVARVRAKRDGTLAALIEPMAKVMSNSKRAAKAE